MYSIYVYRNMYVFSILYPTGKVTTSGIPISIFSL